MLKTQNRMVLGLFLFSIPHQHSRVLGVGAELVAAAGAALLEIH